MYLLSLGDYAVASGPEWLQINTPAISFPIHSMTPRLLGFSPAKVRLLADPGPFGLMRDDVLPSVASGIASG
jgi:hypothetical protein